MFNPSMVPEVEAILKSLVFGVKGVRHIRGCSDLELECFKISFAYQRHEPPKNYLLIFFPEYSSLTLCADGGIGRPPENVRQRLFQRIGRDNYSEGPDQWTMTWGSIALDEKRIIREGTVYSTIK